MSRPLYEGLYINEHHKRQLKDEFGRKNKNSVPCSISSRLLNGNLRDDSCYCLGVEPWTFEQHRGEAIFIPAGCPFQVRNLQVNIFLCKSTEFLFPCA